MLKTTQPQTEVQLQFYGTGPAPPIAPKALSGGEKILMVLDTI